MRRTTDVRYSKLARSVELYPPPQKPTLASDTLVCYSYKYGAVAQLPSFECVASCKLLTTETDIKIRVELKSFKRSFG
jgi:hypothetical protein